MISNDILLFLLILNSENKSQIHDTLRDVPHTQHCM